MEEGAPKPKRPRLSGSCGGRNKACIIFYCREACRDIDGSWISRLECNICAVDLQSDVLVGGDVDADGDADDDKGFTCVCPTLQIDYGGGDLIAEDAFCVLGGKLYILEGFFPDGTVKKSVFAFDLESSSETLTQNSKKLEKGGPLLETIGYMLSPKIGPVALPTPDGEKIVVFPTIPAWKSEFIDFELFDPANPQSPERLPPITDVYCLQIEHYGFIQNSDKLMVQILSKGIFVLDLTLPDRDWVKLGTFYADLEFMPPYFICGICPSFFETVEDGRFCFVSRYGFYDLKEWAGRGGGDNNDDDDAAVGFVSPVEQGLSLGRGRIDGHDFTIDCSVARCLDDEELEEGQYHFCQMAMERLSHYTESCRVEICVCCVDLKSYKEMVGDGQFDKTSKLENTRVVKKHKFLLDFGGKRALFYPTHLFITF